MKKMLILNGSHSEISLILEAKKMGYYVITTGNCPNLIGHQYADKYVYGDYSDKEKMLEIAVLENIDAVCSCANDFGIITAAYIGEKMNLKGHDSYGTTLLLHQKNLFKQFCKENGVKSPLSDVYHTVEEALLKKEDYEYPVIIKPVDLTGGHGVNKVNNADEYIVGVKEAFERSREKIIVVEKFIEGTYHSFSTFVVDKRVIASFSDNEYAFSNPYGVATSGGPATHIDKVRDILIDEVESIADKLGLVNGVFHTQYVMDKYYNPYIIDITRRCSGDLYPEPVEHATNLPWSKWIVMSESGVFSDKYMDKREQSGFCGRHCIMSEKNGIIKDVVISKEIEHNIYKSITWWKKGTRISNYKLEKLGVVFFEFSSEEEMQSKIHRIGSLISVDIEEE